MLPSGLIWAFLRPPFRALTAFAFLAASLVALPEAQAHDDHGAPPPAASAPAAPRVSARSPTYEVVGVLRGGRLVIYLDRASDNAPVPDASLEVTVGDAADAIRGEAQHDGTYTLAWPGLPERHEVALVFSITGGSGDDLLPATLHLPHVSENAATRDRASFALSRSQQIGLLAAASAAFGILGLVLLVRRRFRVAGATVAAAFAALGLLAGIAHSGRDPQPAEQRTDTPTPSLSLADAPSRLPDGALFIPKSTQRLLDVRTAELAPDTARRAINLIGRTIADPHRTSLVQSINGGRVVAPAAGLPRIGQTVNKGDLLAEIEPSFPLADRTTIAERLGEIEQLIAVAESKLRRNRSLADQNVVPRGLVIDAEAELEGLLKRREVLRSTRAEPELLRASTSGVITAARVMPGQVVQAQDVLFQIVDPASLWVEALIYDAIDPASLREATAMAPGGQSLKLKFEGYSRALQQHASVVQFSVQNPPASLGIGLPVTVIATTGEPVTALIVARDAVVRSQNGETIVWRHVEPERFEPRAVRIEPLDTARVVIAAGVGKSERVVVRGADLVNQVR